MSDLLGTAGRAPSCVGCGLRGGSLGPGRSPTGMYFVSSEECPSTPSPTPVPLFLLYGTWKARGKFGL